MNWLIYTDKDTGEHRFISTTAVSMGGVHIMPAHVTLYAPRLPPLYIKHDDPAVTYSLGCAIAEYVRTGKTQVPAVNALGLDINALLGIIQQIADQAMNPIDTEPPQG